MVHLKWNQTNNMQIRKQNNFIINLNKFKGYLRTRPGRFFLFHIFIKLFVTIRIMLYSLCTIFLQHASKRNNFYLTKIFFSIKYNLSTKDIVVIKVNVNNSYIINHL